MTRLLSTGHEEASLGSIVKLLREEYGWPEGVAVKAEAERLLHLVRSAHSKIAYLFGMSQGIKFQRIEGDGLIKVVNRLRSEGIPAYPIHDSVWCPPQHIERAMQIVREEFSEYAPKGGVQLKAKDRARRQREGEEQARGAGGPQYSKYSSTELISKRPSLHIVGPTHEHQTGPLIVGVAMMPET